MVLLDILIGETYTWDLIMGASQRLSENLRLIPTTLGMMLGGELKDGTPGSRVFFPKRYVFGKGLKKFVQSGK